MLVEAVQADAELAGGLSNQRPLLRLAASGVSRELSDALIAEENAERERDRLHWQPLKAELEQLRHAARKQ
jgi:hypothetical protein